MSPTRIISAAALMSLAICSRAAADPPRVLDDRLELTLVASEPDIVTPIGLAFDHQGRLLAIESHTHFPPEGYQGPKFDRIRIVDDTDGDGRADRFRSFHEGTQKAMSIARGPDDWIYLATRMRIVRLRDTDGDDRADEEQEIARLETPGDYPHNGLCGLAFDHDGGLYFGLGENLGAPYTLVGSDGAKLSGEGEGGSIYHCRVDGADLRRVATGFWNPFGICVDPAGRVFEVGNDPDASPPCRLAHVVQGGDYGFQFRYGRSGRHPLQAWDGELPGTLPMTAGTSEAPSDVLPYHGQLYVSSWGEYCVERFRLVPHGASWRATREIVVQGDDQFRPIDFAVAPDGSLYFSDWVDRSYEVHGKGRIWRLRWRGEPPAEDWPQLTDLEKKAASLAAAPHVEGLSLDDPFLRQAAVAGLVGSDFAATAELASLDDPRQALGLLEVARRSPIDEARRDQLLRAALESPHADVRLYAVRWIADKDLVAFHEDLDRLLASADLPWPLFRATLAAREWLDTRQPGERAGRDVGATALLALLEDASRSESTRAMALRMLGPAHPQLTAERLQQLIDHSTAELRREAVQTTVLGQLPQRSDLLITIATNNAVDAANRADALCGLAVTAENRAAFEKLATDSPAALSDVARRSLRRADQSTASSNDGGGSVDSTQPPVTETDAWLAMVGEGGDRQSGWRLFFGQSAARCANCHSLDGQGADVGPDLSGIARRMGRRRVLESLLQPSREIAPRYVPWNIQTNDGRVFAALSLGVPGSGPTEQFLTAEGQQLELERATIEAREPSTTSIMPEGQHQQFTPDEMRDLLALLEGE